MHGERPGVHCLTEMSVLRLEVGRLPRKARINNDDSVPFACSFHNGCFSIWCFSLYLHQLCSLCCSEMACQHIFGFHGQRGRWGPRKDARFGKYAEDDGAYKQTVASRTSDSSGHSAAFKRHALGVPRLLNDTRKLTRCFRVGTGRQAVHAVEIDSHETLARGWVWW